MYLLFSLEIVHLAERIGCIVSFDILALGFVIGL